ncbi:hypothetical protein RIF29_21382 [Crotalaria pallida]|uniref:Uncharacterized protein n=1 Tax=Crotalaria pallida TaxID=3830 RepID=A0AAN9IDC5_CROPI
MRWLAMVTVAHGSFELLEVHHDGVELGLRKCNLSYLKRKRSDYTSTLAFFLNLVSNDFLVSKLPYLLIYTRIKSQGSEDQGLPRATNSKAKGHVRNTKQAAKNQARPQHVQIKSHKDNSKNDKDTPILNDAAVHGVNDDTPKKGCRNTEEEKQILKIMNMKQKEMWNEFQANKNDGNPLLRFIIPPSKEARDFVLVQHRKKGPDKDKDDPMLIDENINPQSVSNASSVSAMDETQPHVSSA